MAPPPRPAPPPPVVRSRLDLHQDNLDALPPTGPLSPGTLRLTFAVPQPPPAAAFDPDGEDRLPAAILVPGLADLAAGSLPIRSATVTLDGDSVDVDLTAPGFSDLALPLPPLAPQQHRDLTLAATFTDTAGATSEPASVLVPVTDKRPVQPIETGIGLFWTSAPGPAPDVQLRLTWRTAPGARSRVYVTDQQGLGLSDADLAEPVPGAPPSRGRVAEVGGNRVLHGPPVDRRHFRLLAETGPADAIGTALLDTTLPRSLRTVQFIRIVPLGAESVEAPFDTEGAETPFDACGIVPVAVPDDRRPPAPRLDGAVDPATGFATLVVTTDGFDGVSLRRDEPGLYGPPLGPGVPPSFRIRRTVHAVADPVYARPIADGDLLLQQAGDAGPDLFSATRTDNNGGAGLAPYVRYTYWAEVRLPPERRLPARVNPIDAGVTTADPRNAADAPRPLSPPSAPRTLLHAPPDAPAAPAPETVAVTRTPDAAGGAQLVLTVTDPPLAHPLAIAAFRVAIWVQWPNEDIQPATAPDGTPFGPDWPVLEDSMVTVTAPAPAPPASPAGPLTVLLAFVDPLRRVGAITQVAVP